MDELIALIITVNTPPLLRISPPSAKVPAQVFLSQLPTTLAMKCRYVNAKAFKKHSYMSDQSLLNRFSPILSIKWQYRDHGDCRSVMVITHEYHNSTHKPPPVDASMQKEGAYLWDTMEI